VSSSRSLPLDLASLSRAYRAGTASPTQVVESVFATIAEGPKEGIWISLRTAAEVADEARALERRHRTTERLPLYGIPFAVKDNIDVAGMPTTVGCPDFAYVPGRSAPVVDRLIAAGALCIGKTNLDQFATGLVGVRSPYGVPPNPFNPAYVTGGSSSGSAAAVARGQVSFSLATDTAGSGRVPAAFNNIVGLKPSRGLLSTAGLFPACRSMDCMTVLALTCEDARDVAALSAGFDPGDPFSRRDAARVAWASTAPTQGVRLGIPRAKDLDAVDTPTREAFAVARGYLERMGAVFEEVDLAPFFEAGQLLYGGPWIAERLANVEAFRERHSDSLLPVIRAILADGEHYRATDAFRAIHRLAELRRASEGVWDRVVSLVVPTAPLHPTIDEVSADPIRANVKLGRYTTFANLLDLAAVAVPSSLRPDGLPFGITFLSRWGSDAALLALASGFHRAHGGTLGATSWALPVPDDAPTVVPPGFLAVAVVGAHLSGEPLNHQLTDRGATCLGATRTAPRYRLYALPDTRPAKPGLVRVADGAGSALEVEVWAMPLEAFGSFISGVRAPLAIGTVELEDGSSVHGFLCESHAIEGATDISSFGGWRGYLKAARA
jgi:allophanate hydrolase